MNPLTLCAYVQVRRESAVIMRLRSGVIVLRVGLETQPDCDAT